MTLTDKQKINVCKYWEENQDDLGKTDIDGYVQQDVANLLVSIAGDGGLTIGKVENYRKKIETHGLQKQSYEVQKKQGSYKKEIIIILITAFATALVSNIDRIFHWLNSLK